MARIAVWQDIIWADRLQSGRLCYHGGCCRRAAAFLPICWWKWRRTAVMWCLVLDFGMAVCCGRRWRICWWSAQRVTIHGVLEPALARCSSAQRGVCPIIMGHLPLWVDVTHCKARRKACPEWRFTDVLEIRWKWSGFSSIFFEPPLSWKWY